MVAAGAAAAGIRSRPSAACAGRRARRRRPAEVERADRHPSRRCDTAPRKRVQSPSAVKRPNETVRTTQPQHGANAADLECIRRIAAGDAKGVVDLYDRHATGMYSLALYILADETDAKAVVQDVFVHVWREGGRDELSQGIVGAWLLMLTKNRAIERRQTMRAESDVLDTGDRVATGHTAPTSDYSPAERTEFDSSRRVRRTLEALPSAQRRAIEMICFEGLTVQEIARVVDQPSAVVLRNIRLALLTLRAALRPEGR